MSSPRCPKCNAPAAYIDGDSFACMMCGKRWPVNSESKTIVITKITGGKKTMPEEIKKTSAGKKGPCSVCRKTRFIVDRDGRCSTCSRAAKAVSGHSIEARLKKIVTPTEADFKKYEHAEDINLRKAGEYARIPGKSALDMTITEVAWSGMAHIIDMMQAERAARLAEADKLWEIDRVTARALKPPRLNALQRDFFEF